jgi:hypothetical protein
MLGILKGSYQCIHHPPDTIKFIDMVHIFEYQKTYMSIVTCDYNGEIY